jgi:hypothetical protein
VVELPWAAESWGHGVRGPHGAHLAALAAAVRLAEPAVAVRRLALGRLGAAVVRAAHAAAVRLAQAASCISPAAW